MSEAGVSKFAGGLVTLAILVSRSEALCVATLLEHHGVHTYLSGSSHASIEVNSLALGGHYIQVPDYEYVAASEILRAFDVQNNWRFSKGLQTSILKFLGLWVGIQAMFVIPSIVMGWEPVSRLVLLPLSVISVPVSPQGSGDYYLALQPRS